MLIGALRVKNEDWILKFTLSCLTEICDAVVCVNDGSTDKTMEILQSFPIVKKIHTNYPKNDRDIDEPRDWNKLVELAQSLSAKWIIFQDADEMLSPNFLRYKNSLMQQNDFDVFQFRKITPWFRPDRYRVDMPRFNHPPEKVINPIMVRATTKLKWDNNRGSIFKKILKKLIRGEAFKPNYGKVYPYGVKQKPYFPEKVISIHYNYFDFNRVLRKQIFYAIREREVRPDKKREDIINFAANSLIKGNEKFETLSMDVHWEKFLNFIERSKQLEK